MDDVRLKIKNQKTPLKNVLTALAACTLLAACNSEDKSFNDVIPKLLNPNGQTPMNAAGDVFDPVSADKRREAIAYLNSKKWGHEEAYMKAYAMLATDPDPLVKAQAIRALGESGNPETAAVLVKGLEDANVIVRQEAAAAAHKINSGKLIDPLVAHMIKDPDLQTRINCTQALDKYATPKVLVYLAVVLDDKDPAVAYWAWDNLSKATGNKQLPRETKPCRDYLVGRYPPTAQINTKEEL